MNTYIDGSANKGITFNNFKFPTYWGINYPLSNTFAYSWSATTGLLIDLSLQGSNVPNTAFVVNCEVSEWDKVY